MVACSKQFVFKLTLDTTPLLGIIACESPVHAVKESTYTYQKFANISCTISKMLLVQLHLPPCIVGGL